MDTTIATANAWQRMLRLHLLPTRPARLAPWDDASLAPRVEAGETLPMLYRSEGFAEDLAESHPAIG